MRNESDQQKRIRENIVDDVEGKCAGKKAAHDPKWIQCFVDFKDGDLLQGYPEIEMIECIITSLPTICWIVNGRRECFHHTTRPPARSCCDRSLLALVEDQGQVSTEADVQSSHCATYT